MSNIKQFRYLLKNDLVDLDIINWSRCFEYAYVIDALKKDNTIKTVHNTSSGGWQTVHQQFINKLDMLVGKEVTNSDAVEQRVKNFHIYNILDTPEGSYDCCLSISTLEDFGRYDMFEKALTNLLAMTKKRLIVTMDCNNGLEVGFTQKFFNLPVEPLMDSNALRGGNSVFPNNELNYLRIILLDVEK